MDVLILTASLLLAVGVLVLILYPLWQSHGQSIFASSAPQHTLENYEARYQAALAAIKELMFDYEMGKVSEEDYQPLLTKTKLEAAEIRRQIDRLSHQQANAPIDAALDAEIESLISQLRTAPPPDDQVLRREIEAEIEMLKGLDGDTLTCPNCGRSVGEADAFCSGCGQSLEIVAEALVVAEQSCPTCGYTIQPDDAFCAQCGAALKPTPHRETEEASL